HGARARVPFPTRRSSDLKSTFQITDEMSEKVFVIPPSRTRYLSEIAENNRAYDKTAKEQVEVAQKLYGIYKTLESVTGVMLSLTKHGIDSDSLRQAQTDNNNDFIKLLIAEFDRVKLNLDPYNWEVIKIGRAHV